MEEPRVTIQGQIYGSGWSLDPHAWACLLPEDITGARVPSGQLEGDHVRYALVPPRTLRAPRQAGTGAATGYRATGCKPRAPAALPLDTHRSPVCNTRVRRAACVGVMKKMPTPRLKIHDRIPRPP